MSTTQEAGAAAEPALAGEMRGVRAGTIVLIGIAAGNLGNYLFHFVSARFLGPGQYGDVASLVALSGLISLPLVGVQLTVARYVAGFAENGDAASIRSLTRRSFALGLLVGSLLTALLLALSLPLQKLLNIDSLTAVALTLVTTGPAVLAPVALGLAQGLQRFGLFALTIGAAPVVRVVAAVILLGVGFGVAGAIGATLAATMAALTLPLWPLRSWFRKSSARVSAIAGREALSYLLPVVVGVLAVTSLTTVDVIVAKAVLSDDEAGIYGSASLIGRVILYLPAAIVMVLLPKVSARTVAGRETLDVLAKSLLVTGGFCLAATALYASAPGLLVFVAFGSEFEEAAGLLWMFAVAMTGFAIANVLLAYQLGRGSGTFSWLLAVAAVFQLLGFAVFHESAEQLLAIDICVALAVILLHELFVERTLVPVARELATTLRRGLRHSALSR
jgi:O-antigen/teichoic acid export membrane protein